MAARTGVHTSVGGLVGTFKVAMPCKEGGIGTRFGSRAGAGCSKG